MPRATRLLFQVKLYDGAGWIGLDAIQTPSTIKLNQLTGPNAVTVILTAPETEVPEGGEIVSGTDAAVLINNVEINTAGMIATDTKPTAKA